MFGTSPINQSISDYGRFPTKQIERTDAHDWNELGIVIARVVIFILVGFIPSGNQICQWKIHTIHNLVGGFKHFFPIIYGLSSFPLTNSHFSRCLLHHQPFIMNFPHIIPFPLFPNIKIVYTYNIYIYTHTHHIYHYHHYHLITINTSTEFGAFFHVWATGGEPRFHRGQVTANNPTTALKRTDAANRWQVGFRWTHGGFHRWGVPQFMNGLDVWSQISDYQLVSHGF